MTDVFVSYSRKDKAFVQKLLEALTRAERDAWVDWEDIPRAADWLQEIYKGIDEAENFLFVVSPNSLTSEVCAYELRHAIDQKKRIIPLILQQIKDETLVTVRGKWMDQPWEQTARDNWKHLQSVNWLMFDDDAQFDSEFAALLTTIEQDYAHVQSHTRFALRAKEWEKRHRDRSSLLIGSEIDEAEAWLQQATSLNKQPPPTAAHQHFIAESRRLDDERRAQEAEQERRTRALESQTQAAALENERLGKRSRQFRLAAALLGIVGVLAVLATIVSVNQTSTALSEAQAANAQVTQAGQTLTPILATLQAGSEQLITATVIQGTAVADVALAQTRAAEAPQTAIAQAGQTLTPIAVTLQAGAVQVADAQTRAAEAPQTAIAQAGQTLTPIAVTVQAGEFLLAEAQSQAAQAFQTLTAVPPTLDAIATQIQSGTNLVESQRLAAFASDILSTERANPELAALLAIRAMTTQYSSQADNALQRAVNRLYTHQLIVDNLQVNRAVYSPDGRFIASVGGAYVSNSDESIRIWDTETGSLLQTITNTDFIYAAAFSPDGTLLVTGGRNRDVEVWDVASGQHVNTLIRDTRSIYRQGVNDLQFSPDGRFLAAAGEDATVIIWDASTGEIVHTLTGHSTSANSVDYSSDGAFIVVSTGTYTDNSQDVAKIWNANSGELIFTLEGHSSAVLDAVFSPDDALVATASMDGTVRIWDAATGLLLRTIQGDELGVKSVDFSLDGALLVTTNASLGGETGNNNAVQVWDVQTGTRVSQLEGHTDLPTNAQFSPDGQHILTASQDSIRIWNVRSPDPSRIFVGQNDIVTDAAFSPDSQLIASVGYGSSVRVWDASTGALTQLLQGHRRNISSVAFSPDGNYLVTAGWDNSALIWNLDSGEYNPLMGIISFTSTAAYSLDGSMIVTSAWRRETHVWDAITRESILTITSPSVSEARSAVFSPDGNSIVTAYGDGSVWVWDARTAAPLFSLDGHTKEVNSVVYSPDGQHILTASDDKTARVWNASNGELVLVLAEHPSFVTSANFSPDGHLIVTSGGGSNRDTDNIVRIWDASTGVLTRILIGHQSAVSSAEFSSDGRLIVTAGWDGTVRLWHTDYHDFVTYACTRVFRDFTPEERQQYGIDDQPTCPQFAA